MDKIDKLVSLTRSEMGEISFDNKSNNDLNVTKLVDQNNNVIAMGFKYDGDDYVTMDIFYTNIPNGLSFKNILTDLDFKSFIIKLCRSLIPYFEIIDVRKITNIFISEKTQMRVVLIINQ